MFNNNNNNNNNNNKYKLSTRESALLMLATLIAFNNVLSLHILNNFTLPQPISNNKF